MATGLSTQLTRQIGEHLVTAELGRRQVIGTPFAGNVPDIDILAFANGISAPIQVKAINGISWQFDVRSFLDVIPTEKGQKVNGLKDLNRKIICIFVVVGKNLGEDTFYIFNLDGCKTIFAATMGKAGNYPKILSHFTAQFGRRILNSTWENGK